MTFAEVAQAYIDWFEVWTADTHIQMVRYPDIGYLLQQVLLCWAGSGNDQGIAVSAHDFRVIRAVRKLCIRLDRLIG
ncbi:hypothetical protein K5D44_12115 [Pseudomonas cichorii]|nr:hypothetical protein [Pseudomonas cichorii]MBX8490876.1 hypothetical protein [Pseudomonas cichorii]MBX8565437.1 hypothetical protein [Pseudomonas cichorii]MBX8601161.1 hypothetical protein [Pseudomonas cichorii]